MNIVTKLAQTARLTPQKPALIELAKKGARQISYSQLFVLTREYAGRLKQYELKAGAVVLLMMPLSLEFFAAMLAVNSLGLVAMVVDPTSGFKKFSEALTLVNPALVVVGKNLLIKGVARLMAFGATKLATLPDWQGTGQQELNLLKSKSLKLGSTGPDTVEQEDFIVSVEPTAHALITFTSGTTGRAKAIARSHAFLQNQANILQSELSLDKAGQAYSTLPVFTLAFLSYGVTTIFSSVAKTGEDFTSLLKALTYLRPDTILASPRFVERLAQAAGIDACPYVKHIYTGGAPVFASTAGCIQRSFSKATITTVYGSTEAEPVCHLELDQDNMQRLIDGARYGGGLCQGMPSAAIKLLILPVDWSSQLTSATLVTQTLLQSLALPAGQIGEIVVSGDHVVKSYLTGESKNKIATTCGSVWHATGDAGYLDDAGLLYLAGRVSQKSQIVQDRYPLLIEARAMSCEEIGACAYVEVKDQASLVVTFKLNRKYDKSRLLPFCLEQSISLKEVNKIPVDKRHQSKILYEELRASVPSLRTVGTDDARTFLSFKGFDLRSRNANGG